MCPPQPITNQYNQLVGNCNWQQVTELADGTFSTKTISPADYYAANITPDTVIKYMTQSPGGYSWTQVQACLAADFPGIPGPTPGNGQPWIAYIGNCQWELVTPNHDGTFTTTVLAPSQYSQNGITVAFVQQYLKAAGYPASYIANCVGQVPGAPPPTPTPTPPSGTPCTTNAQCGTGTCVGGYCTSPTTPTGGGDNTLLIVGAVGLLGLLGLVGLAGSKKQQQPRPAARR